MVSVMVLLESTAGTSLRRSILRIWGKLRVFILRLLCVESRDCSQQTRSSVADCACTVDTWNVCGHSSITSMSRLCGRQGEILRGHVQRRRQPLSASRFWPTDSRKH